MTVYSLEQGAEQVYHPKTKEYFKEVLQSYINESYRSAVVMLYSVVMCDLIYKLNDLKELYNDEVAISILKKVEKVQEENKSNPGVWESLLIEEIKTRTLLLEPAEKINLDMLRQYRHLSAHPVLTQEDLLLTPNKETVRALIRNMLEGLLIKNPVMSKKVFTTLLADIKEHKDFFLDDISLGNYIESRYLKNTNQNLINLIFKDLWNITFHCESTQCKENREINYRTLKLIYKKFKVSLLEYIEQNPITVNKFNEESVVALRLFIEFIAHNRELYSFIEKYNQVKLNNKIAQENSLKVRALFLRENIEKHLKYLIEEFHWTEHTFEEKFCEMHMLIKEEVDMLYKWSSEQGCEKIFYDLLIKQFIHSGNFDTADIHYNTFIKPNLSKFDREQFISIYDGINRNRQCHAHRYAKSNNTEIKSHSDIILGGDFDYEGKYSNVKFND